MSDCKLVRPEDVLVTDEYNRVYMEAYMPASGHFGVKAARSAGIAAVLAAIATEPFTDSEVMNAMKEDSRLGGVAQAGGIASYKDIANMMFRARILKPEPEIPEALKPLLYFVDNVTSVTAKPQTLNKKLVAAFRAGEASAKGER